MTDIILNEKTYAENALDSLSLGIKPSQTLGSIAKYYYNEGYKKCEIGRMLEDFLLKCDPSINITKWQDIIDRLVNTSDKYRLINLDGIDITKNEIATINSISGRMRQKFAFTALCLAKYGNAINPNNNCWVNKKDRDVFSLSNIKTTIKKQSLMINDLWTQGFIGYSKVVDNINIRVNFIDINGPVALRVTDFRNIGNQYLRYRGESYMECLSCGLIVKRESNSQKYCLKCSEEINKQKTLTRIHSSIIQ